MNVICTGRLVFIHFSSAFIGSDAQGIKSNNKEKALVTKRRKMMRQTKSSHKDFDFQ